jgi:hypothetical protein
MALQTGKLRKVLWCWEGKSRQLPVFAGFLFGSMVMWTVDKCRPGTVKELSRDCVFVDFAVVDAMFAS